MGIDLLVDIIVWRPWPCVSQSHLTSSVGLVPNTVLGKDRFPVDVVLVAKENMSINLIADPSASREWRPR